MEESKFGAYGLLDLYEQVDVGPHLGRVVDDGRAGARVGGVGEVRADPRSALHEHCVPCLDQLLGPRRGKGHPQLSWLDLLDNTDAHLTCPRLL